ELFFAALVLAAGVAPVGHVLALFVWIGAAVVLSIRYLKTRGGWTDARLDMTHDLVERMVGHRTRLAQEAPERWHDGEDQAVERYLDRSISLDRLLILLSSVFPRGWMIIGIAIMIPSFAAEGTTATGLAVSLGGVLLARGSLTKLLGGLSNLAG